MASLKKIVAGFECGNCGQSESKPGDMQVCGRCRRARYCNRACQAAHWKKGDHKKFCVAPDQCKPGDQPREDRSAGINCLICLETSGGTYQHDCRALLHPCCVADLFINFNSPFAEDVSPLCPLCRVQLPSLDLIMKKLMSDGKFDECKALIAHLPPERYVTTDIVQLLLYREAFYYRRMRRFEESRAAFLEYLKLDETDALAHCGLAYVYSETGEHELAEAEYRRAIQLKPRESDHHYNYGSYLITRFKEVEDASSPQVLAAVRLIERAIELDPKNRMAIYSRGFIHFVTGNWSEALAFARRAVALDDKYAAARLLSGRALKHLGCFEAARDEMLLAAEQKPVQKSQVYASLSNLYYDWADHEVECGRSPDALVVLGDNYRRIYHELMEAEAA